MKRGFIILLGLFLLALAPALFADTFSGFTYGADEDELLQFFLRAHNPFLLKQFGLDNEQIERLRDWQERARTNQRNTEQAEANILADIKEELRSANPDERKLENLIERRYELKKRSDIHQMRVILKVREMLGDEKFDRLLKGMRRFKGRQELNHRNDEEHMDNFNFQIYKNF